MAALVFAIRAHKKLTDLDGADCCGTRLRMKRPLSGREQSHFCVAASVFPYFYRWSASENPKQPPKGPRAADILHLALRCIRNDSVARGPISKAKLARLLGGSLSVAAARCVRWAELLWPTLALTRVDLTPPKKALGMGRTVALGRPTLIQGRRQPFSGRKQLSPVIQVSGSVIAATQGARWKTFLFEFRPPFPREGCHSMRCSRARLSFVTRRTSTHFWQVRLRSRRCVPRIRRHNTVGS